MEHTFLPSDDTLRWVVSRYARLRASFSEALGDPDLIEPSGKHFPDAFALEPEAILRLVRRTMTYAPLSAEVEVELGFVEADAEEGGGGCGTGACKPGEGGAKKLVSGAVVALESGGYGVPLRVQDVGNPVILDAAIARAVGDDGPLRGRRGDRRGRARRDGELAALSTGLGVLLLNGACVYMKGCGGLRAHQGTHLGVPELAVATALFCRVHGVKAGVVRGHLETTQTEAFDEALRWVDSNDEIVAKLRATPELLADGVFTIAPIKGFFGRLFGRRRDDDAPPLSARPVAAKVRTEAEERRLREMRALVEDALKG